MPEDIVIAPSILSADFRDLAKRSARSMRPAPIGFIAT